MAPVVANRVATSILLANKVVCGEEYLGEHAFLPVSGFFGVRLIAGGEAAGALAW